MPTTRPTPGPDHPRPAHRRAGRGTAYRRAFVLALAGVVGLATPALASGTLDDIRDRIEQVEKEQERATQDRLDSRDRVDALGEDLEHTSAELVAADERLRQTTAAVEQARIVLQEAELDLADAEAEAARIETELGVARANESSIEEALASNAEEQADTRTSVGAIARESYKQGGMGSLATTLELLSGEADAVDQMAMARTVLRLQDQQIRALATQEAEQVAEQDRLAGVRQDIAYLLAKAEAVVVAKDQARAAADAAKTELEALEAEQEQAREELEAEKARVEASLAAEEQVSQDLEDQLAELARTRHGLEADEKEELERIAAEEARRKAEEEARRKAAEEAARQAAAEEAARQRAAEREAERQRAAAAEAQRQAEEAERRAEEARRQEAAAEAERQRAAEAEAERQRAAAEEAERRAAAAQAEADAAARAAREAEEREAAQRQADEEARRRQAEQEVVRARAVSSGYLRHPVNAPTSSEYGNRLHPVMGIWLLHAGLDFAAGCGTPVVAAADGVVFTTGYNDRSGNFLVIDHGVHRGVNLTTAYMHFQAAPTVGSGQTVSAGEVVGHVGTTGSSTGCHLHFETRQNGSPVNPRTWL